MRNFQRSMMLFALVVIAAANPAFPQSDEKAESPADQKQTAREENAKARLEYMINAMKKFRMEFKQGEDKPATLDEQSMLHFSNPVSGTTDGIAFIYRPEAGARPVVVGQYHLAGGKSEIHEFAAVVEAPFVMLRGARTVWSPASRYGSFKPLEKAPMPVKNAALRLAQMKKLAKQFEVFDDFGWNAAKVVSKPLRFLPRPLYRYGGEKGEIVDGAVFVWALGTDPEAFFLIEAHRDGDDQKWRYAFFPSTIYKLEARLNDKVVWEKPRALIFGNTTAPYFVRPYRLDPGDPGIKPLLK